MQFQEKYDSIIFLPYTCSQVFAYINNVPIVVCRLTLTQEEHQLSSFNSLLIHLGHRAKSKIFLHKPIACWSKPYGCKYNISKRCLIVVVVVVVVLVLVVVVVVVVVVAAATAADDSVFSQTSFSNSSF